MEAIMKRSLVIFLASLVLLLGYSLPSQAQHFRGGVWIGPGWGPGWWGAPYYGYGYPYAPYYSAPPVVIQQQPQEYIQQPAVQPQQQYWYYCTEAKAYYPYVKQCPGGWNKVVPRTAPTPEPPDEEE
jgi:hypothetical protein